MAERNIITMSVKELKRLHIIRKVLDKRLKGIEAAEILNLERHQITRMVKRGREEGDRGVIHRYRGKTPHNEKNKV